MDDDNRPIGNWVVMILIVCGILAWISCCMLAGLGLEGLGL